jgi:hypothetical protein
MMSMPSIPGCLLRQRNKELLPGAFVCLGHATHPNMIQAMPLLDLSDKKKRLPHQGKHEAS